MIMHDVFKTRDRFDAGHGRAGDFYSLRRLEQQSGERISRLPVSLRIILESILRNHDGVRITEEHIRTLAKWEANADRVAEIPFVVARVLLQDFTGVPLLVDLAAMRDAVAEKGMKASLIEPQVPVDLIVDHSVQVDRSGTPDAFLYNLEIEFERNRERYEFLKWGQEAFKTFEVIPPGIGICHQVNLENLGSVVMSKEVGGKRLLFFDTLV